MTEYSKKEFRRLLDKVPETDPSTTAYHVLMQSIEMFNAIALTIDEFLDSGVVPPQEQVIGVNNVNVVPFTAPDFPAETPEEQEGHEVAELVKKVVEAQPAPPPEKAEEKTYTSPEVRKALVDARGKGVNVKEILAGFGAENFQALPASKYGALMEALEVIG